MSQLSEWIANLSRQDAEIVANAMEKKAFPNQAVRSLPDIDFLDDYEISYLGGGNSRNYLIKKIGTGEEEVLKLEDRLGNDFLDVEEFSQDPLLKDTLTATYLSRNLLLGGYDNRQLQVTEYCPGHDLQKYSQQIPASDHATRLEKSYQIYNQMSHILQNMLQQNTAHVDMKNSNWLIDDKENLRIADTKGLFKMSEPDVFPSRSSKMVRTSGMIPPETGRYSAEKAEVYLLGKNLYEFLSTGHLDHKAIWEQFINHQLAGDEYDFDQPLFTDTAPGRRYCYLLSSCLQQDPDARPTLDLVQKSLAAIKQFENHEDLISRCDEAMDKLGELDNQLDEANSQITDFYQRMEKPDLTPDEMSALIDDVNHYYQQQTQSPSERATANQEKTQRMREELREAKASAEDILRDEPGHNRTIR